MLIEEGKTRCLVSYKVGKSIASMPLNEFIDYLGCIEKDVV